MEPIPESTWQRLRDHLASERYDQKRSETVPLTTKEDQARFEQLLYKPLEDLLKPCCSFCRKKDDLVVLGGHHACERCLISLIHHASEVPFCLVCDARNRR